MENQMTVDEQLDRMNEAEFKAFLEACAHKTKRTLEQAAMFSQLERHGKTPEEQIPPLTTTNKHSSSLQSLSQSQGSNSRKNSQIHSTSKSGSSSASSTSSCGPGSVGPSSAYPISNNNTHHHHPPHLNSSFNSNNNHNSSSSSSVHNTNWIVTGKTFQVQSNPPSSTGATGDHRHHHADPFPYNSQNPQQNVNCVTMVNNSQHHLYNPPRSSTYYSSTPSSPSLNTEEDTTIANSNNGSPNPGSSYSTTSFTATAPPISRGYRYHSHPLQNPKTTTPSPSTSTSTSPASSISVNFNLKRPPPPKPVVQNHIEVTASATLPSPYFFNSRTADHDDDPSQYTFDAHNLGGGGVPVHGERPSTSSQSSLDGLAVLLDPTKVAAGNFQLKDYPNLSGAGSDLGSYSRHRISPRDSRSGTPVHGETAQASLNVTRRIGSHGSRNKKPKETILSPSERPPYIGDRYENLDDLVFFISGDSEKATQSTNKKQKKKVKRKDTLSKSHSLDENTLGTEVNPAIETRSVSSTLLENKTEEKSSSMNTTEGLDLSPPAFKLESLRNHPSTEFITVTNRKKNKGQKAEGNKSKLETGAKDEMSGVKIETSPKVEVEPLPKPELIQPPMQNTPQQEVQTLVPKLEVLPKPEPAPPKDPTQPKPEVTKAKVPPVRRDSNVGHTCKAEPLPEVANSQESPYSKQDSMRRQEVPIRRHQDPPQPFVRKYPPLDPPRRHDSGSRRPLDPPPPRRQDQGRRKERDDFPQSQHHEPNQRRPLTRYDSEPRQFSGRYREPVSKSASLSSESMPEGVSSVKSEDAVKFCGVNFDNKPEMLNQPNVNVEFGFGVTDVLTQLAIASPVEVEPPCNVRNSPNKPPPGDDPHSSSPSSFDRVPPPQAFVMGEIQSGRVVEQVPHHMKLVTQDASLLGRHPQSGSPPIHYLPMSVPLPMSVTGYQMPTQNYYQTLQHGVMQYFPGPLMPTIQQMSAPIMTAIPTQGTPNIQPQFINPLALTPQQHQIIHQHQLLQQQQQHQQQHPPALQHALQQQQQQQLQLQYHPVLVKTSPQQQQPQFTGNQQNLGQYAQIQNSVPQHVQQGYNPQPHGGNYNYHRGGGGGGGTGQRSTQNLMNCNSQMSNYGISPQQQQQQYPGASPQSFIGQSSTQHYNSHGPQGGGVHYNSYHRNNSRNLNQNQGGSNYGGTQSSPQPSQGSGTGGIEKSQRHIQSHPQSQNLRSQPNHVTRVSPAVNYPPQEVEPTLVSDDDGFVRVDPETNPLSYYYTPPSENEENEKYGKAGQEYMDQYVEKLHERVGKGATIHRI